MVSYTEHRAATCSRQRGSCTVTNQTCYIVTRHDYCVYLLAAGQLVYLYSFERQGENGTKLVGDEHLPDQGQAGRALPSLPPTN